MINPIRFAMRRPLKTLMLGGVLVLCGGLVGGGTVPALDTPKVQAYFGKLGAFFQGHREEQRHEAHKITATTPQSKAVTLTQQYVCQIHSQRHIKIRALEMGYLEAIPVKEGQLVQKDELMFSVKPVLYKSKLDAENAEVKLAELEVRRSLEAEVSAERWTRLDRLLAREASAADRIVDLRPEAGAPPDPPMPSASAGCRHCNISGVAEPAGPSRRALAADAGLRLRERGERGDIIKRLYRSLTDQGVGRDPSAWVLEGERPINPHSAAYNPLLEIRRGDCEVRDAQNIADILVDPEGALERRNHWEKTSHSLLVGAILHVLYAEADKTARRMPIERSTRLLVALRGRRDSANGGIRREPKLPQHEDVNANAAALDNEFESPLEDADAEIAQARALSRNMQGIARVASLDPADDLGL